MGRGKRSRARRYPGRSQRRPILTGTVQLVEHGGFVRTAEGDFKIQGRSMREVMDGDTVAIVLRRGSHGEMRAVVESVIERKSACVVGIYRVAGPLGCVRPLDARLRADFFVMPRDASPGRLGVVEGDVVVARVLSYPTRSESATVTLVRRIGDMDAPEVGIQCVMARYGLVDGYPEAAVSEAVALRLDVASALEDPLRRDIRDRFAITIDPIDARDFDDAISIERTSAGGFRLGVHIADVSHYVAWGSSVDLEARRRTTSVYLADRVLPMLPEELCCDLCSLRPAEDRLAFTVDMELDARGRVRTVEVYPSAIRSRVRMDYAAADALLVQEGAVTPGGAGLDAATVDRAETCKRTAAGEGVDLAEFLSAAHELAEMRQGLRHARGSIDFDTVEVHALLDNAGRPVELTARHRTAATGLVEEAMLLANECVAEILADAGAVCAFRVHEPPSPDSLYAASQTLAGLGVIEHDLAARIALGDQHAMQQAVEGAAAGPYAPLVNTLMLRAMQRAIYKPQNEGHYALGAPAYCHFTSPIRRYPDLLAHRALKMLLARDVLGKRAAAERAPQLVGTGKECLERMAPALCRSCSDHERAADAAAKDTQKIKIAQFFEAHIGERYAGSVSWVSSAGLFVRLDDTQADGLVPVQGLGDEWFDFDERDLSFTGAESGTRFELGMRAIVEIKSVNTVRGHLNFALVHAG